MADQEMVGAGHRPPPPPPPPFRPAYYVFSLDSFTITETRSLHNDTDHVTIGLKVGGKVFDPQTKHMGDVNNGTHAGLQFGPFLVDAPTTPIAFNFQILNNGHASQAEIEPKGAAAAIALLAHVFSLSTPWTAVLGIVFNYIWGVIFADCDGPVAVDHVNWTGADLWGLTHGVGTFSQSKFYPGIDSATGCGDNSQYYVQWSAIGSGVAAQSEIVVCDLRPCSRDGVAGEPLQGVIRSSGCRLTEKDYVQSRI
jgi:hypothetical protein